VKIRAPLALFAAILLTRLFSAEIGIGDNREDVLIQLGKPTSIARRGDREIFLYPKGGRVEFVGGKVENVKGPLPAAALVPATPTPTAPTKQSRGAVPPNVSAPPQAVAKGEQSPTKIDAAPVTSAANDYNPAVAANELAKHVEKMDTAWGQSPVREKPHSSLDSVPSFLTGLLLRFVFTIAALKLAFKYWEMDAFWIGIFTIAGIDLALHATFELLGPATGGFTTLAVVENGVPGLALIYTINRFCFNKRIQNAVVTAAAVKLVVTLCYIFAGVAMLHLLYN
jgi:hypothetical protein